jgi:hypothetical protein
VADEEANDEVESMSGLAAGSVVFRFGCALALLLAPGCSGEGGAEDLQAGPAGKGMNGAVHLEAWSGASDGLLGEASYKSEGPELKVEVERAKPGTKFPLSLDGFGLGDMIADMEGEAEFELAGPVPAGCPTPKAGSVIRVGETVLELKPLERQVDLQRVIAGPGQLAGKVTFRVDRLGDAVAREFEIKLKGAPPGSKHPVTLAGQVLVTLEVDDDGEGKLELSTRRGDAFPAGFVDPSAGGSLQIGSLFSGQLEARVAAAR